MFKTLMAVVLACAACSVSWSADGPAYELKLYKTKPGDKYRVQKTAEDSVTTTAVVNGQQRVSEKSKARRDEYVQEILEKPEGARRVGKAVRTYTVAEATEGGKTTKRPYHGKTVLIEKTDRGYRFTVGGKVLSEEDAEGLASEFRPEKEKEPANQDFLPDRAVRVGERWTRDAAVVLKNATEVGPFQLDVRKASIQGKLVRVYERAGVRFGVIELDVVLPVRGFDPGTQELETKPGSKLTLSVTSDMCIDGSTRHEESTVTSDVDVTLILPNEMGTVRLKGKTAGTEQITPADGGR